MRWRNLSCAAAVIFAAACTAKDDTTNQAHPGISVAVSPASASVAQGSSTPFAVTVTGAGGFSGDATITAEGLPAGITATVATPLQAGNVTTATVTLAVGLATATGTYPVTVRARGTGVTDATTLFSLTVSAAAPVPNFSITVGPSAGVNIAPGYTAPATIGVDRTLGFSGAVSFTVTGAPNGLTLLPAPASTTGSTATFGIAASVAIVPGTYPLTIHGTAPGLAEETATLSVIVGAAGSGNVTLDFSTCSAASKPIWVATRDGSGPWTQGTGAADVYRFNANDATAQVAWVSSSAANAFTVHQLLRLRTALTAATQLICGTPSGTKVVNGVLANLATGFNAKLYLGGGGVSQSVNGAFQIGGVLDGNQDLVGYERSATVPGVGDRALLRRSQNIVNGGTLGLVDMSGVESFAPMSATFTAAGAAAGESIGYSMEYFTGTGVNGCQLAVLYGDNPGSNTFTAFGIPAAQQLSTDFHGVAFSATEPGNNAVRTVIQYFHAFGPTTIALPAALPAPTFTNLGGPYRRLQAAFTMPADYPGTAQLQYNDPSGPSRFVVITADGGAFATQGGVLALQDFSAVQGWNNSWAPTASNSNWSLTGISAPPATACQDGAKYAFSQRFGTF